MAREYAEYRTVIAYLREIYGDKCWITCAELSKHDGPDVRTIKKLYRIPPGVNGIDIAVLAHRKCELAH